MANPNILGVSSIYGTTIGGNTAISFVNVLANPVDSGKVYKIVHMSFTNTNTTGTSNTRCMIYGNDALVSQFLNIDLPAYSTYVAVTRDIPYYLTETQDFRLTCASGVDWMISYEEVG